MSSGVMTYRVINVTAVGLLRRLLKSVEGDPAEFEALSLDDPLETDEPHRFQVRMQTLHADIKPLAADVLDQNDNWFQIVFYDEKPIEFEIIATT